MRSLEWQVRQAALCIAVGVGIVAIEGWSEATKWYLVGVVTTSVVFVVNHVLWRE